MIHLVILTLSELQSPLQHCGPIVLQQYAALVMHKISVTKPSAARRISIARVNCKNCVQSAIVFVNVLLTKL